MATTSATKSSPRSARRSTAAKRKPRPRSPAKRPRQSAAPDGGAFGDLSKMAKLMTPEQAFELYRANAKIALEVINAALESTARMRRLQFAGEEDARSMQKKAVRHAAEAGDAQALVAAGQTVTQEAVEKAMLYWRQMFEMIVEMQKRLFALMQEQMNGMPGAREVKTMLAMMPDPKQARSLIDAMQGVMASGGSALSSMQRVIGDLARMAQPASGGRR